MVQPERGCAAVAPEVGLVVARTLLVYTWANGSVDRRVKGSRSLPRRTGPLHRRIPGFFLPFVSGSQRHPDRGADDAAQGADGVLRVDDDAGIDRGLSRVVRARATRR